MNEELSIPYFRNLLEKNINELKGYCKEWKKFSINSDVPEVVTDEIRTTIGLTNLLLQQKMKQFSGLIDDSEFKKGEKEITCLDLQGFWDMVYNEVEKIQRKFKALEKCQKNNWVFVEESIKILEQKKKPVSTNAVKTTIDAKARALAARQRLAEAKLKMKAQMLKKPEKAVDVQILGTVKANVPHQKLVDQDVKNVVLGSSVESKINVDGSPLKGAQKKIENLKISEKQDDLLAISEMPSKKVSSREVINRRNKKQKSSKKEKENFVEINDGPIAPKLPKNPDAVNSLQSKKGRKEIIPLQCVTRSAKRAMLAQKTH